MAESFRDPEALLRYLELPVEKYHCVPASSGFAFRATRSYCQRIEKGNPDDPLLRQVLPLADELESPAGYTTDPVGDSNAAVIPGLLHKYHGRVLLITTAACAIHCRYCFRRDFPYSEQRNDDQWQAAIDYIQNDPSINEVILSGGDPLSLTELKLSQITDQLASIPHLKTLRIHSRIPVILPERLTDDFIEWLDSLPWQVVLVTHVNHGNEIDQHVSQALEKLSQVKRLTLLNQSVLLAGVNDSPQALASLSSKLFDNQVLPYYLHLLDKVKGASHFDVPSDRARQIMLELQQLLPGYLVPRLVQEIAGENAKTPV